MESLRDKIAIVTGGSKGIGKAIAHALARQGMRVMLAARSVKDLDATVAEFTKEGLKVSGRKTDIAVEEDVKALVGGVVKDWGGIDILVNNAGMGVFKPVAEMDVTDFDRMWQVNMRGVFLATKAVLPHMIRAETGAIVNIASLAGKNSFKGGAGYCATKWAIEGLTRAMAAELPSGMAAVPVIPGFIDTEMLRSCFGADAANYPDPAAWAAKAVPFLLSLGPKDNGKPMEVPE